MGDSLQLKPSSVRLKIPNPLFEKWLSEWDAEEVSLGVEERVYGKALESLKKYPLVLKSGLECIILEHFDLPLCEKLNKKLQEHTIEEKRKEALPVKATSSGVVPRAPVKRKLNDNGNGVINVGIKLRKAADSILLALILAENESGYAGYMTKQELQGKAQLYCRSSMKIPQPGSFYTGWSSMSRLISQNLVAKQSNPAKFSLTPSGREAALKLKKEFELEQSSGNQLQAGDVTLSEEIPVPSLVVPSEVFATGKRGGTKRNEEPRAGTSGRISPISSPQFHTEEMVFLPQSFKIILLVDTAETVGAAKRNFDPTIIGLTATGINFEVRHLKIGDYIWLARDSLGRELVLPFIVERKRLDDLSASIKDGRFHEQKFRLSQCGLPNRIYLVEKTSADRYSLPLPTIWQAVSNTMVCDRFSVKLCNKLCESVSYLARTTQIFIKTFKDKTLFSCTKQEIPEKVDFKEDTIPCLTYEEFQANAGKSKAQSPREMFAQMLVQLHGLSPDKAWVITELYPTPRQLIKGFLHSSAEAEIANLIFGLHKRRIGPQIASTLKTFYTTYEFPG